MIDIAHKDNSSDKNSIIMNSLILMRIWMA